jgi:hypothetical protein
VWATAAVARPGSQQSKVHQQSKLHQPNGVNFTLHLEQDQNFCVEAPPEETTLDAIVSQCAARDDQDWTFPDVSDGSIILIDGAGQCVDFGGVSGTLVDVVPCTFASSERFHYTAKGQFQDASGKYCLEATAATQDASLEFTTCSKTAQSQVFVLGH